MFAIVVYTVYLTICACLRMIDIREFTFYLDKKLGYYGVWVSVFLGVLAMPFYPGLILLYIWCYISELNNNIHV